MRKRQKQHKRSVYTHDSLLERRPTNHNIDEILCSLSYPFKCLHFVSSTTCITTGLVLEISAISLVERPLPRNETSHHATSRLKIEQVLFSSDMSCDT